MAGVKRRRVGGREVADPQNYAIHWLGKEGRQGARGRYIGRSNFFSRSLISFVDRDIFSILKYYGCRKRDNFFFFSFFRSALVSGFALHTLV